MWANPPCRPSARSTASCRSMSRSSCARSPARSSSRSRSKTGVARVSVSSIPSARSGRARGPRRSIISGWTACGAACLRNWATSAWKASLPEPTGFRCRPSPRSTTPTISTPGSTPDSCAARPKPTGCGGWKARSGKSASMPMTVRLHRCCWRTARSSKAICSSTAPAFVAC
ncbi:hypothetical protein D3C73_951150 [compost metagenome]